MGELFLKIINMSITAGWIVLAVILFRLLFKKAPKWITCLLWGLVAIRLIFPFSIESALSLLPSGETIPVQNIFSADTAISDNTYYYKIDSGFTTVDNVLNPYITDINPTAMRSNTELLGYAWLIGIAVMLFYTLVSYLRLKHRISEAVVLNENILVCDRVSTPFILGIIKPKIILPSLLNDSNREYVIAHEKAHIKRFDHLWKPFGFLLLSIYWFNPVLWLGYILLCRDIELACDERVIKDMNSESKKKYATALLECSMPRRMIAACPLAFGEVGVKGRIKSALSYKKPAFWIIIVAVILTVALSVGFLTNPAGVTIPNIGTRDLSYGNYSNIFDELVVLEALSGAERYYIEGSTPENRDALNKITVTLKEIKVSKNPISRSRAEDRDKTHTLVIANDYKLHFSKDYTKFWINNGVKPTFTHRVLNPLKVKAAFKLIKENRILYTNRELIEMVEQIANNKQASLSSNPYDYIEASYDIYKKLLANGNNTVNCFVNALRVAESYGLEEYIMAAACSEITDVGDKSKNSDESYLWSTADEWLKLYDKALREAANKELNELLGIEESEMITLRSLRLTPKTLAYEDGRFSYSPSIALAPEYSFHEFSKLSMREKNETKFTSLGDVAEITLDETNFDSRLTQNFWLLKFTASGIRHENSRAYELKVERNGVKELYIILEQKNGTHYLCYGYYDLEGETDPKTPDNSFIRWIYLMDSEAAGYNPNFNARVLEIYDDSILVEPYEGENERKSADKITIGTKNISESVISKLKVGSEIRVVYNGVIRESYPAQLGHTFAIYFLDELDDIK